ncbi:MAG: hypothetical protein ACOX4B_02895 [Bacillota bacterium]|jgi:hypothetical protein|nr:hypothetical protein [Candidatus Fermentithermobacillaceae bacterium]
MGKESDTIMPESQDSRMYLYHYYERENGPFLSLSDLPDDEAQRVQDALKKDGTIYAKRDPDGRYMFYRRMIERRIREMFVAKGGKPIRQTPRYMIIGECDYCRTWYREARFIRIPISAVDLTTVSFTYGDSFPTFDPTHGDKSEYRQNVYTYEEITEIIAKYGWPNVPCDEDVPYWLPRYVEAQVWSDVPLSKFEPECMVLMTRRK